MIRVEHADSREALPTLAACSIDSCVTDPPYSLVSIRERWGRGGPPPAGALYQRHSRGFMGKQWDTGETAFDPAFWRDVLRVLRPGAHLVAFGGTRTYHRLACAIEDAGFEIRDQIGWLYGSGFPKSHDVSKAIDRSAGAEREIVGSKLGRPGMAKDGSNQSFRNLRAAEGRDDIPAPSIAITAAATDDACEWEGWGTALKPAWEPIVLARKPLAGTIAANVLAHGTGGLNIDGCRIAAETNPTIARRQGATNHLSRRQAREAEADGRIESRTSPERYRAERPGERLGRWPANVIHDGSEEVVTAFPGTPGAKHPVTGREPSSKTRSILGLYNDRPASIPRDDEGTAARFFYSAKADSDDRLGSKHPTVKPVDLMAYLCRLVTPPKGLVLDPFAGSGTTGMACMREGFDAILIEREAEYVADIRRRLAHVRGEDAPLFQQQEVPA